MKPINGWQLPSALISLSYNIILHPAHALFTPTRVMAQEIQPVNVNINLDGLIWDIAIKCPARYPATIGGHPVFWQNYCLLVASLADWLMVC